MWVREEMEQLEVQGEWEQTWGEYKDRDKRRREWEEEGWEQWEVVEEDEPKVAKVRVQAGGSANCVDPSLTVKGSNEGEEDVRKGGNDVEGDGGRGSRVNLSVSKQPRQRKALRGRHRGGRAAKEEENKRLSLYMGHWLASNPPRQKKN